MTTIILSCQEVIWEILYFLTLPKVSFYVKYRVLFLIFVRPVFVLNSSSSFGFSYIKWNNEIMRLTQYTMHEN